MTEIIKTGVDILAGMILATCVEAEPYITQTEPLIQGTKYECPLMGNGAAFFVWRRICSLNESYAVAIMDYRDHRGFSVNRFREMEPAFVDVREQQVYLPHCDTNGVMEAGHGP